MNLHLSELESSWEPRLSRKFSAFVTNMTLKEEIVQQLCLTGFMTHFVDFSILKLFTKEWSEFQYYSRYLPNWHVSSMWQHLRDYSVNYIYSFYIKFCIIYFCAISRKDDLEFWNINELLLEPCCALKFFPDIEVQISIMKQDWNM